MTDVLRGQDYVLEVEDQDNPGTYLLVSGQGSTTMEIDKKPINVSNKDTPDNFQRLGNNMGEVSVKLSANGMLSGNDVETFMLESVISGFIFSGRVRNRTTGVTITGDFLITKLKHDGKHQDKMMYDYSLENDGPAVMDVLA